MKTWYVDLETRAIVDVSHARGTVYVVNRVNTPRLHRGKGVARELMRQVLEDADREGVTLTLWINASDGLTRNQLKAWYRRLGFAPDPTGLWLRSPRDALR
jgi:GNAT superfamily N-acetyltransferase